MNKRLSQKNIKLMNDPYALFQKFVLPSGLTVWHLFKDRPFACFEFLVHAGSREDTPEKEGLAHFSEHLVSRNIPGHPNYREVKKWFGDIGGRVAFGSTSFLSTIYDCKVPTPHIAKALDIFGSMLVGGSILSSVEEERAVIQREYIRRYPTALSFMLDRYGKYDFFPNHRANHSSPLGIPESINNITHADINVFHKSYYCPQNITIVCVGGITADSLEAFLSESPFGVERDGVVNKRAIELHEAVIPPRRHKVIQLSDYLLEPAKQSDVRRFIALPARTDEFVIKGLVSLISTELYAEVREKRALSYQISVNFQCDEGLKIIMVKTLVPPDAVDEVNELISQCIRGLPLKEVEFDTERALYNNHFITRDQNLNSIAESAVYDLINTGQIVTVKMEQEHVQKLQWSDFYQTIQAMLEPERNMSLFIVP